MKVILTISLVGLLVLLPLLQVAVVVAFSTLPSPPPLRSKKRIHTSQATSTCNDGDDDHDNHDNDNKSHKNYTSNMRKKVAGMIAKEKQREQERSVVSRPTCERCYRPPQLCVCGALPPNTNKKLTTQKTSIWILQHPNERRKRNWSTVPLLKLVLENIKVKVGYSFDFDDLWSDTTTSTTTNVDSKEYDNQPPIPLLLFPGPDAIDLDVLMAEEQLASNPLGDPLSETKNDNNNSNNHILVLIDGTWSEAKKMLRESPTLLERCKLIQFSSSSMEKQMPSIYNAVRKEPEAHCLSTLEACAKALQYLERTTNNATTDDDDDDDVQKYLHNVLETHVNAHLENARVVEPRIKYKNDPMSKEKQRLEIESSLDLI